MKNNSSATYKDAIIGAIPKEWGVVDIGEALSVIDGDRGSNYPSGSDFANNNYCLFLNTKNVSGDSFDFSECQFISKIKDLELRKGKMKRGDFVLTTRGTVGNVAFYDMSVPFDNMRINSGMVILRNDKGFNSKYLFQLLKSIIIKKQIEALTTGSAQPQLPIRDLKNLKIIKPTELEQQKIAEILSSLDDKIALNRKINDNLEKIASSLFKRWFVDFEFPDKGGNPYKSSGGKMVDSEFGKIPDEWLIKDATDLLDFIKGVEPGAKRYSEEKLYNYIDFFRVADIYSGKDSKIFINRNISKNIFANFNDVLITTDGTVGRVAVGLVGSYSGGIRKVLPKKEFINNSFIYFWLKSSYVQNILQEYASDSTTIAHASGAIRDMKIAFSNGILEKFSFLTANIFNNILDNLKEIKNLEYIRDSLLPKLMNGKIRVRI